MDGLFHGWLKNIEYPFISMDLGVAWFYETPYISRDVPYITGGHNPFTIPGNIHRVIIKINLKYLGKLSKLTWNLRLSWGWFPLTMIPRAQNRRSFAKTRSGSRSGSLGSCKCFSSSASKACAGREHGTWVVIFRKPWKTRGKSMVWGEILHGDSKRYHGDMNGLECIIME
jgi:hypothetical protein